MLVKYLFTLSAASLLLSFWPKLFSKNMAFEKSDVGITDFICSQNFFGLSLKFSNFPFMKLFLATLISVFTLFLAFVCQFLALRLVIFLCFCFCMHT